MTFLEIENLGVTYGTGVRAVRDSSLTVQEGEFVALLGSNGAGKTTLLRALSGLLPHHGGRVTSGRILAFGKEITWAPAHERSSIGMTQTFEGRRILRNFTVEENLLAGALTVPKNLVRPRIQALFDQFPILENRRTQLAGLLSGGEQQILAIARAMVSDPKILLLDEPSLGLAPVMIKQVAQTIRTVRALGKTILLVEQNAHLALALADRAYVMQNGTMVTEASAQSLKHEKSMLNFYIGLETDNAELLRTRTTIQEKKAEVDA